MLAKLTEKADRGTPEEKFKATWKMLFLILGIEAVALAASSLLAVGIAWLFKSEIIGMISVFAFIPAFTLLQLYLISSNGPFSGSIEKLSKKVEAFEETSKKTVRRYNVMPHFGKMFKHFQVLDVIKNEEFVPCVDANGKPSAHVKVSKSDKWVFILGGYLPIDLICGYNKEKNEIYAIDGTIIKLPLIAKISSISSCIERFFEERGDYFKDMPQDAELEFEAALKRPKDELSKADWGRVRYLWWKYIASNNAGSKDGPKNINFSPISKDETVNGEIFERVLSGAEIARTVNAVRSDKIDILTYMNFDDYKNEYSVCNGIKILEELKAPKFIAGKDFLFECLRDVDEAYFHMAVDLLKKFPKEIVTEELEKHAKIAYKNYDVMKLGGLLYMAKEINYEIKFIKEVKEQAAEMKRIVPGFDLDEENLFGDDDVQRFSLGAYMYQKK